MFEEQDRNPLLDPELAYYLAADSRRLPDDAPDSVDHGTAAAAAVEGPSQAADTEQDGQPPAAPDPNAQQDAVTNPGGVQWSCHRPDEAAQDVLPPHQHLRTVRRSHRYGRDGQGWHGGRYHDGLGDAHLHLGAWHLHADDARADPLSVLSVRNYVAWLKYDPAADRCTASTLMLRTRRVTLSAAEVQVPDVPGMFATFSDQGESLFADANHFHLIKRFGRIMGYDRPVDLKLTSLQRADGRGGETSEAERSQRIDSHASLSRLPSALPYRGASVSDPTQ